MAAKAETEDNELEQKRQQGKKVLYGQVIQVGLISQGRRNFDVFDFNGTVSSLGMGCIHCAVRCFSFPKQFIKNLGVSVQSFGLFCESKFF